MDIPIDFYMLWIKKDVKNNGIQLSELVYFRNSETTKNSKIKIDKSSYDRIS